MYESAVLHLSKTTMTAEGPGSVAIITTFFFFVFQFLPVLSFCFSGVSANIDSEINRWHIVTKHNFSYEVSRHADILLMVTVPWSGESRALSEQLTHTLTRSRDTLGSLRLLLMYRNNEKILAEAIGATDEMSIIFYHHSFSYKYRGRLRASNILLSAQYLISLPAQELPIKHLTSEKEIRKFVESTDVAVLLLEFCDWTFRKLASRNHNGSDSTIWVKSWKKFGTANYSALCATENDFCAKCFQEFILFNRTRGRRCTFEEFQNFTNFFSKFVAIARDFVLPPEKRKFGLISDRSLLSTLEVGYSGPWVPLVYVFGCHSCSKFLRGEDELNDVFSTHKLLINELEGDKYHVDPSFPTDKPSVVLFIDRTSESPRTRAKSQQAFNVLKSFVLNSNSSLSTWAEHNEALQSNHGHPVVKLSSLDQNAVDNDNKMSFMMINEGKSVVLDNLPPVVQGSSLQDVLGYIIQQRGEQLSSIAKKAGFQLSSNDLDIKRVVVVSPSIKNAQDSDVSPNLSSDIQSSSMEVDLNTYVSSESSSENLDSDRDKENHVGGKADGENKKETWLDFDKKSLFQSFRGHFFFSDGGFHLLEALTARRRVPSVVIIDPVSQQHFVMAGREVFNYSSFSGFLDKFLTGSIPPFERSESLISIEGAPHPVSDSRLHKEVTIPRITSINFWDVVIGSSESDYRSSFDAWSKDVFVLFSSSWCGFCQRMELVVGEVYFTLKGYANMKTVTSSIGTSVFSTSESDNGLPKLPSFYIIDCTLNDCGPILRSFDQSERYPSLVLFPSEDKKAVLYDGDIKTISIMKFIADHGSDFHKFFGINGNMWYESEKSRTLETERPIVTAGRPQGRSGRCTSLKGPGVGVGSTLLATERLDGAPLFEGSVILVVKADGGGHHGLIINGERADWNAFPGLREASPRLKGSPLSVGGPVVPAGMPLAALTRAGDGSDPRAEVARGVHYLDHETVLRETAGNGSFSGYWFFFGIASWAPGQLSAEISEGAWDVSGDTGRWLGWP